MMRAEPLCLADPMPELIGVVDEHLPLPRKAARVHDARDTVGARDAREVGPDAIEPRRDDPFERIIETAFDVEAGTLVEPPDRLKNEQLRHDFPFRQRCHIVVGA